MKRSIATCVLLALPALLQAAVGDLEPVEGNPFKNPLYLPALSRPLTATSQNQFTKPGRGRGIVNPNAIVVTFKTDAVTVRATIDSEDPKATAPDVIRLDLFKDGKFSKDQTFPVRFQGGGPGNFHGNFGPTLLKIQRNGKTVPVYVRGQYYASGQRRYMVLYSFTAMGGSCAFGQKVYSVRILDGNNNALLGDAAAPLVKNRKPVGIRPGDTVIIDTGDGSFTRTRSILKSFYGQPALVDDVWYEVKLSADGSKVSAQPASVRTGQLKIDKPNWQGLFVGTKFLLQLSGTDQPVQVPADRYIMQWYKEFSDGAVLTVQGQPNKVFQISPDKVTTLAAGSPVTATITARVQGRSVHMDFKLLDAAGAEASLTIPNKRPPNPLLTVLNASGKTVYTGKFEYG